MGWNFEQWMRAAEYWRITNNALPETTTDEAMRVMEHWENNHVQAPPAESTLIGADGNSILRFDEPIRRWVAQVWRAFALACGLGMPLR